MIPLPISLKLLADEMDSCPQEWELFVNRATGEIVMVGSDDKDSLKDAKRVEASKDFISAPIMDTQDSYKTMERFCGLVEDERKRDALSTAISSKGAFRRFKDRVDELGLRQQWFDHQAREIAAVAREFLAEHKIAFVDDVGLGKG